MVAIHYQTEVCKEKNRERGKATCLRLESCSDSINFGELSSLDLKLLKTFLGIEHRRLIFRQPLYFNFFLGSKTLQVAVESRRNVT